MDVFVTKTIDLFNNSLFISSFFISVAFYIAIKLICFLYNSLDVIDVHIEENVKQKKINDVINLEEVTKEHKNSVLRIEPNSKLRNIPHHCPYCLGIPDNSEYCCYCGSRF